MSIFWTFTISQTEASTHETITPRSPLPAPGNHYSTFCLCELPIHHISGIIQNSSFCIWLISLSITSSRFIHVAACIRIPLLFMAELYTTLCLSVDGHLDRFHLWAVVQWMLWTLVCIQYQFETSSQFFGIEHLGVELLSHMIILFHFLRNYQTIFYSGCIIVFLLVMHEDFSFSTFSPILVIFCHIYIYDIKFIIAILMGAKWLHILFWSLLFPINDASWTSFHVS